MKSKYTRFKQSILREYLCEERLEANAKNLFICNGANSADFDENTSSANVKYNLL
jgi:hypothetical protein